MAEEKRQFQAEVGKLLDIVVHSLYSNKEIFLRELISNASDSCDRLRYAALTRPELLADDGTGFRIRLIPDAEAGTLTIADNGLGMDHDELVANLGTIAKSGTSEFLSRLTGDSRNDVSLIGQFGVGFYSAFMVADRVTVASRKAGEDAGWCWSSDGKGEFTVAPAPDAERGAAITLHLREDSREFLEAFRLKTVVKRYSDHIAIPVLLKDGDKDEEAINSASALWTRPKSEITPEQYKEFYHHVAHAFDEPWATLHYKAEGAIEYTGLLFLPSTKPFDIFNPDRKQHVKLYVRRVFITDDCEELLPPYLRFVRGIVDSQDLPLNVSREMLQHNPILAKIRTGLVKRILGELKRKAEAEDGDYLTFWDTFGAVLKEGLYEDFERREDILDLCRFRTTASDGWVSLAEYLGRMKEGQEAIYTIAGDDLAALKKSPQLEGFAAKGVEVLLLTDPIDEFWVSSVGDYKDKQFRSVAAAGGDLSKVKTDENSDEPKADEAPTDEIATLIEAVKLALGDKVKDVRASERLTESAVCLVAAEGEMSMHLEKLLRAHRQVEAERPRILELNPRHALIKGLAHRVKTGGTGPLIEDIAALLFDQARIVEGEPPADPAAFARRLVGVMEKGLGA
ncbi:molecular chaperone HtpG [Magnetospirillum molischianum]|uniref:Chaperone protein HtpG n=1 Tax=Magnetospirillum molischianum DSM 120 TaxID=1150626 RepID=H8FMX6_MAGML|nr:molecular chaperone HtpG [Magnetospirillum molischianum]CCG39714.1 Chaperone protein htpG [Magnetospirillum molischianum DSM 120]